MCISATTALAISAAGSAGGAIMSAQGGKESARAMTEQAVNTALDTGRNIATELWEADEIMEEGKRTAERTLAVAREFRGSQMAAAAASGVLVTSGTVQSFMDNTDKLAAADALALSINAGKAATSKRIAADSMLESGVSRARGYVSQAESAYRSSVSGAFSGMMNAALLGFQSYQKFNAGGSLIKTSGGSNGGGYSGGLRNVYKE